MEAAAGPGWRADGKELLYPSPNGTVMSLAIATAPSFRKGVPKSLFKMAGGRWDASPDGNRFLIEVPAEQSPAPFTVVFNWQAEYRR
jgi:hypothetical protein